MELTNRLTRLLKSWQPAPPPSHAFSVSPLRPKARAVAAAWPSCPQTSAAAHVAARAGARLQQHEARLKVTGSGVESALQLLS